MYRRILAVSLLPALILCSCHHRCGQPGNDRVASDKERSFIREPMPIHTGRLWKRLADSRPVPNLPKSMTERQQMEKLRRFEGALKKFAPYILDDFAVVDRMLGWEPGSYMKLACFGRKHSPKPLHECTSWIVMPELAAEGQLILHKNRDATSTELAAVYGAVPGKFFWIGNGNYGSLNPTMGINELGLVVAMNSGDKSDGVSSGGLDTTLIARFLLENCGTADEAAAKLRQMVEEGAYFHGKSGSIWFFADARKAYIVEHDARRMEAKEIKSGFAIRANAWHYPEMIPFSGQKPEEIIGNNRREHAVRQALFRLGTQYNRHVTVEMAVAAARIAELPEDRKCYPLCGPYTNSAATFSIDREFPAELSTMYAAFGPPGNTVFIPVPVGVEQLPDELLNGSFSNAVYRRIREKKTVPVQDLAEWERKLNLRHKNAREKARALLRQGKTGPARRMMVSAFLENWREISRSGIWK